MHWSDAKTTLFAPLISQPRLGLITDVDGTISPIAETPDLAIVTTDSKDLLRGLQRVLPLVAVISGRAAADVRTMVDVPGLTYIGNHGLEWWADGKLHLSAEASAYRPALEAALQTVRPAALPGMLIEDKGVTISIHYRQTANPDAVEVSFLPVVEQIATQHGLVLYQGRRVFELRPPVSLNKGTALMTLIQQHQLGAAVYLGDDTTDVDALLAARRMRQDGTCYALGVGVESAGMPDALRLSADVFASSVQDVEQFLGWLLNLRRGSTA